MMSAQPTSDGSGPERMGYADAEAAGLGVATALDGCGGLAEGCWPVQAVAATALRMRAAMRGLSDLTDRMGRCSTCPR